MDDKITVSTEHKFTLEQLEMLLEAVSMYIDFGRRARTALFDKKNRMISRKKLADTSNPEDFAQQVINGEIIIKWVPIGPKFTEEEVSIAEDIHEFLLTGLGTLEEKIEVRNTEIAEENIDSVVDSLYEMLKDNNEQ